MGYNLTIGEGAGLDPDTAPFDVHPVRLAEAPAYGEPTDHTSARWPSYSGWGAFLKDTDLEWLSPRTSYRAEDAPRVTRTDCPPLMVEHPGVSPILPVHLTVIEAARARYRLKLGAEVQPGWPQNESDPAAAALFDGHLARLEWLHFWVQWALTHCKSPVFVNT